MAPPGQHGRGRGKPLSMDSSFVKNRKLAVTTVYLKDSSATISKWQSVVKGPTGENLLAICESRLDNIVYRLGFAMSRPEARQLVNHGHFLVNGRKVNIPSFLAKPGMVITLRDKSRQLERINANVEANSFRQPPKWLEYDPSNFIAKVVSTPQREDIDLPVEETLIVELYSK